MLSYISNRGVIYFMKNAQISSDFDTKYQWFQSPFHFLSEEWRAIYPYNVFYAIDLDQSVNTSVEPHTPNYGINGILLGTTCRESLFAQKLHSGVELWPWTFQWDLTLHLLIWTVLHINRCLHHWYMIVLRIKQILHNYEDQKVAIFNLKQVKVTWHFQMSLGMGWKYTCCICLEE